MVQMKLLGGVVFALCLLVTLGSAKFTGVDYCDKKANYTVKVSGLDINPFPIRRNKDTTFQIIASTGKSIAGGKLVIAVSYFGFHVYNEVKELCKETTCPVSVGDFSVSHSQSLPGYTPPGNYNLKMKMEDGNEELTCISFDFSIGFFSEEVESLADA